METNVRVLREAKSLSIRELSTLTGINRGRLSIIERGIYHPTNSEVESIVSVLGEPVEIWHRVPIAPREGK